MASICNDVADLRNNKFAPPTISKITTWNDINDKQSFISLRIKKLVHVMNLCTSYKPKMSTIKKRRFKNNALSDTASTAMVSNAAHTALDQQRPAIVRNDSRHKASSLSEFLEKVDNNHVLHVDIVPGSPTVKFLEDSGDVGIANVLISQELIDNLYEKGVDIQIDNVKNTSNPIADFLLGLFPFAFAYILISSIIRAGAQSKGGNMPGMPGPMGKLFGGSNYDLEIVESTDTSFDDVAGIEEEQRELTELVDFLKDPQRYTDAGAKVPKGCLLSGPPGTGKTLLAKAIAGEANVPFIACSASQFIELFVGLGASRIRGLFEKARENAPCIIFIDEIDAIAKQRGGAITAGGGGNDEREQTLNQLLTEMDGFGDNSGIIILGATNRPEIIDPAVLRPGRFDRKVNVGLPDVNGREKILGVHSRNKVLDSSVDLSVVAKSTVGCSGADLMNIMNEAAILAARDDRKVITKDDVDEAYEKISIGLPKNKQYSPETVKLVSYHEAGHALCGALSKNFDKLGKVTIVPRGNAGGLTQFIPEDSDIQMYSKTYLCNQLVVALGGRAAEEIVFGPEHITTGASSDLQRVSNIARSMVTQWGFSGLGTLELDPRMLSDETNSLVDAEVRMLVNDAYHKALETLKTNKSILDKVADLLMEKETIDGSDVYAAISCETFKN